MGTASLTIDLGAIVANWRALDAMTRGETGACVKADAYGLGADKVARALMKAGCRTFFVAVAEEGAALRNTLGDTARIFIFSGHMRGDTDMIGDLALIPLLNSLDQVTRHLEALPGAAFGIQLDSGMNRLGMEPAEWAAIRDIMVAQRPALVMSHLACADEPRHGMNAHQLAVFQQMVVDLSLPLSLAATGGVLLGKDFHFDLTRPGIGLYGGAPFTDAAPVVRLSLPVIQTREIAAGETVGYGNIWKAKRDSKIATVLGGYADGLIRAIGRSMQLFDEGRSCPLVGRVSMDLITVDVTDLPAEPHMLDILCPEQRIDDLATAAGTIGYEILTSLGARYTRQYISA